MSIYENIIHNRYRNNKRWPGSSDDKKERRSLLEEYNQEEKRLLELFYSDICEEDGIEQNVKSRKVFEKAWEGDHSSGLGEVYHNWLGLWDFLESLQND